MIYLLLSIISSTVIFVTFKITQRYKADLIKLITVNYLVGTLLGFSFNHHPISISESLASKWIPYALLIGALFILMFFLIGYSIRNSGVAVTTIAGKMSMVIPILFSMYFFSEEKTFLKISGLVLATIAVFMTSYRPVNKAKNLLLLLLPILIFFGSGITDAVIKYAQNNYIPNQMSLLFPSVVFLSSLIFGLLFILVKPKSLSKSISISELIGGTILGIANFCSLYFFILALNNSQLDSSVVFGMNNICIVLFSILIGLVLFKEKFSRLNFAGVFLAIISILILMNY